MLYVLFKEINSRLYEKAEGDGSVCNYCVPVIASISAFVFIFLNLGELF
jgi:hypothetical protein